MQLPVPIEMCHIAVSNAYNRMFGCMYLVLMISIFLCVEHMKLLLIHTRLFLCSLVSYICFCLVHLWQ